MVSAGVNFFKFSASVTYENLQGQKPQKTELENPGSLPNSWDTSVSAMPLCNGWINLEF